MRIMAKYNETDTDMVEFWCKGYRGAKMLMCIVHKDTISDIPHVTDNGMFEAGDDLLDGGMMLELVGSTVSKEEAKFWGI